MDAHFRHCWRISIHSLRVEGDLRSVSCPVKDINFNPLPPCGGRLCRFPSCPESDRISIHSLRVEGDRARCPRDLQHNDFNPLPPCGGRLRLLYYQARIGGQFQSTPSVWRETFCRDWWGEWNNFNPLPPCGGRRHQIKCQPSSAPFQSTPSVWRETLRITQRGGSGFISIHSLRVEGDPTQALPRLRRRGISIHSLRVEGDYMHKSDGWKLLYLNPLPPCGGRHFGQITRTTEGAISIHSLRVEGDAQK